MLPNEPEIVNARLAFADAQGALGGVAEERLNDTYTCGWFGTSLIDDRGSLAVVNEDGPLADCIGDRLRIIHGQRSVVVYCFGSTDLDTDLAIARRAFAAIELLAAEELDVELEVLAR